MEKKNLSSGKNLSQYESKMVNKNFIIALEMTKLLPLKY
jgi:hypothetical protein